MTSKNVRKNKNVEPLSSGTGDLEKDILKTLGKVGPHLTEDKIGGRPNFSDSIQNNSFIKETYYIYTLVLT